MGEMTHFRRPDGQKAPAYHADPDPFDREAGVVVIQEWWGINAQMIGVADRIAEAGYHAVVPDLYRGRLTADADEAHHMMTGLDWVDACHQDVQGAVDYLRSVGSSRVAVLGFCMGGALTIAAAVNLEGVDAGVCFYGIPPRDLADPTELSVPMLLHFATDDAWCNAEAVDALEKDLRRSGAEFQLHRYPETQHAFANEARPEVYHREAAALAWERTLDFLGEQLG